MTLNIGVSIIEDDAPVRKILAGWLSETDGFRFVSEYGTAQGAVAHLPQDKPDVVLVDINLAGQSGIHCVCQLKPLMPQTQFLMLTVYEDSEHIFEALAAGATGYLLKRTEREGLLAAIKEVHAGGSPMTSYIARKVVQAFQTTQVEKPEPQSLSPREREVLRLLAHGYMYKEICEALNISMSTVNTHIHRIYEKLHVQSRSQAVARYARFPEAWSFPSERRQQ
jgi:DNA-binding NarL/FixJ family response regulator